MVQPAPAGGRTLKARYERLVRSGWLIVAAVLLVSDAAGAQGLGRLFSTPEERGLLDVLRARNEVRAPSGPEQREEPARVPSRLMVNGLVTRERGPDSVWINGERVSRDEMTSEGIRVQGEAGARVRLILPRDAGSVRLKAGQKVDLATGSIRDAYEVDPGAPPSASPHSTPGTHDSGP